MRHHIEKRKAVILKKVMLVALQTQLFPEFIDQIHVDLSTVRVIGRSLKKAVLTKLSSA